jgi:hypothetical protein
MVHAPHAHTLYIGQVPVLLQFFANDACEHTPYGEGKVLVGSATVVTVGSNVTYAAFNVSLPTGLAGKQLTATSTFPLPKGITYEFSACVTVTVLPVVMKMYFSSGGMFVDGVIDVNAEPVETIVARRIW